MSHDLSAAWLLKKLIGFASLTPDEAGSFEFIKSYLSDFETIETEKEGVKNLFLYKKFGDGEHICFAGHVDVVPAGGGWISDPFAATEKDGVIYGRGAADMKGGVAAFLYALRHAKEFDGTLSALLTSDEEGDAIYGTDFMLGELQKRGALPDFCLVAEPTSEKEFGDAIKVGRRGSINGRLKIIGRGGHAAYPEKSDSPIVALSRLLPITANALLDDGDEYFAPSRLVITDIKGGYGKHNVIPSEVELLFNIRNGVSTSVESARSFVESALYESNIHEFELQMAQSSNSFVLQADKESKRYFDALSSCVIDVCGVTPKASTAGGTSDARFIAKYNIAVLELGVKNETIHAPNECVAIEEVEKLTKIFEKFIEATKG